jgi:hypothetical protein
VKIDRRRVVPVSFRDRSGVLEVDSKEVCESTRQTPFLSERSEESSLQLVCEEDSDRSLMKIPAVSREILCLNR